MESNDRMSEIARDLKKDVKELLFESAAVVTSFFKRGLCTVRAAADKWKTFARNVSTAADELMKPPLIQEMEVPATDLLPTDEPVVTVVESGDLNFPVGMKLSLSAANEYVRQMDALSYDAKSTPHTVRIKIDYTQGETRDRYTFPLQIGSGRGGLLEQMERNLTYYRADPERIMGGLDVSTIDKRSEAFFRSSILPLVQKSVEDLYNDLLPYFRRHCSIAELKKSAEALIPSMGESQQERFRKTIEEQIAVLRQKVNSLEPRSTPRQVHTRQDTSQQATQATPAQSRRSVRGQLKQIRAAQSEQSGRAQSAPSGPKLTPVEKGHRENAR